MTCKQTAQIQAYYDGELLPEQRAAVESHIVICAECRELLEDLQRLSSVLAEVPLPEMRPGAVNRMYGSFWAARKAQDRGIRHLAEWLSAVAAVVLVLVPLSTSTGGPGKSIQPDTEVASTGGNAAWVDTIAIIPPSAEQRDNPNSDLMQVAQFLATDLSTQAAERQ